MKLDKTKKTEKIKNSRWSIVIVLAITVLLSVFFWLKNRLQPWWNKITKPSVYTIEAN